MRRFVSALLLLSCFTCTAFAGDRSSQRSNVPAAPELSALQRSASQMPSVPRASVFVLPRPAQRKLAVPEQNTCLTLRTYYFERFNGGDAMRPVGEATCTPAARFQANSAVFTPATR